MSILKVIATVAIVATLSIGAQAANPKTETKSDAKAITETAVAPSESSTQTTFIYYVVGRDDEAGTYELSTSAPAGCGTMGAQPCKITTETQHSDLEISQDDVDNQQNGVTVNSRRASL